MTKLLIAIFTKLLSMSFEASLVAAAVIVLRLLFRRAPKWTHCLMWALVAVKLLCPVTPQSNFSLMPSQNPIEQTLQTAAEPTRSTEPPKTATQTHQATPSPAAAPPAATSTPTNEKSPTTTHPSQKLLLFTTLWLLGLLTLSLHTALCCWNLRRKLAEAVPLQENIYLTDRVNSAFLFGVIHPKIYLPFGLSEATAAQIIAHETAHLRRRDHLTKPLALALASVYWFNPVIWLSYVLYCRDIELACDESVIRGQSLDRRKAYSRALLECSTQPAVFSPIPIAFGKTAVKRRVTNVLKNKKPTIFIICGALAATAIVAAVLLTRPQTYPTDISADLDEAVTKAIFDQNDATYTEVSPTDNSIDGLVAKYNQSYYFDSGYFGDRTDVECVGEGHIILGTQESDNQVEVYALCSAFGYGFRDGYFVENAGYSQIPTRFTFETDANGGYTLKEIKEAEDGSGWEESVYKMFPKTVADKVCKESHEDYYEELTAQCNRCAEAYLKKIGRDAEVSSYHDCDFKILTDYGVSVEVSNALMELHPEYNIYVGRFETIEDGTRYLYSQIWSPDPKTYGNGTVTFLKCEYATGKEIEKFAYAVTGDTFTQINLKKS